MVIYDIISKFELKLLAKRVQAIEMGFYRIFAVFKVVIEIANLDLREDFTQREE